MNPDRTEAERFLKALDPSTDRFTFQTFDDDAERKERRRETGAKDPFAKIFHGTLAQRWDKLVKLNEQGAGIFVTVNETDFKGRSERNIVRVRAVFVDLDGAPLQPVLEGPLKPHIIVETSPGKFHCYWRVVDVPLEQFTPLQKSIAARFGGDPTVHDLPRVARLAGFLHRKSEPCLSRIKGNGHA
jgi:RepB DNA-primase N-terminal domain